MAKEELKLTLKEWNKLIDDHMEYKAKRVGKQWPLEWKATEGDAFGGISNKYITADLIRIFAWTIGDPNPLWSDPSYAKNTRWGGVIAPPTFEDYVTQPHSIREPMASFIPGFNQFDAGASREYFTVIRAGDVIVRGIDTYLGVVERTKPGKVYRLFNERGQRTLYNDKGEKVVSVIAGGILTGIPPGKTEEFEQQVAGEIKRRYYTKEELDTLHAHYDAELEGKLRRGAEILYWEDVNEGEEIPTIIKGPLDDADLRSYMGGGAMGFAIGWAGIKRDVRPFRDPETGAYRSGWAWHASDSEAKRRGIPYALAEGKENQTVIAHGVTNWMGDDGFVKKLDLQNRSVNYLGNMNWVKGKIVRKYAENGEHLVDLDLYAECEDGRIHTKGTGTVRLLSREG
jgi:hypothetical protein